MLPATFRALVCLFRIRRSPGAVQGLDALAEICNPPEPEPSRLELLAGSGGIRCRASEESDHSPHESDGCIVYLSLVLLASNASGQQCAPVGIHFA